VHVYEYTCMVMNDWMNLYRVCMCARAFVCVYVIESVSECECVCAYIAHLVVIHQIYHKHNM
jgi:hypothetical protein